MTGRTSARIEKLKPVIFSVLDGPGFFLECGAYNGEALSNSLFFGNINEQYRLSF